MELYVLVDNNTLIDRYFIGEPGVSYYIKEGDTNILFDTGYSDAFIKNAQKMHLNVLESDYVVLSHGHIDHTWGLVSYVQLKTEAVIEQQAYKTATLVAHPHVFLEKKFSDEEDIGSILETGKIQRHFHMNLTEKPVWLTEKLVFLGEIPRNNKFEAQKSIGHYKTENGFKEDYVLDDSALVYKSEKGLVIVTGCAHSGICNTIEYAKVVCKEEKIADVIGGFHLLSPDSIQLEQTIDYMKEQNIQDLHACHCTDLQSKIALSKASTVHEVGVGLKLEYK